MTRSSTNRLFAAGGLGLAAALFLGANSFPDRAADAARYIFFLAGTLAALSLILFLQNTPSPDSHVRWIRSPKNFTMALASMAGYGILTSFIGFFPASALFIAAKDKSGFVIHVEDIFSNDDAAGDCARIFGPDF